MKKIFAHLTALLFTVCGLYYHGLAQLPNCTNIYLDDYTGQVSVGGLPISLVPTGKLYTFDPTAPVSATNPSLNTISLPPDYYGGITISEVLNSGNLTQTFYCVTKTPTNQFKYSYYDPTTNNWVNTGHNSGSVNIAAGGNGIIYSLNGLGTVYKYNGTGDATALINVPNFFLEGPLDLIADCEGNWYILNFTGFISPPFLRKYSPTGTLLESWTISNPNNYQMNSGGGFAIVNNMIYVDAAVLGNPNLSMAYATLTPGNIVFNNITNAFPNNVIVPSGNGTNTQQLFADLASCSGAIPTDATITVTANPNAICARSNVSYTTTITHGGNAQYQWFVNGVAVPGATGSTFNYSTNMNDQITCQLTSSLACVTDRVVMSAPAVIDVVDGVMPVLSYPFSKICEGEPIQTDPVLIRPQNGTFSVSPASGLTVNTSTGHIDFKNAAIGNYTITYTTKGNINCPSKSISVPMNVLAKPYTKIDRQGNLSSLCDGSDIHLSTPYYPNTTYDWWPDHFFSDSFFENAITGTFPEGNSTVSVYVTDSNGCSGRDTILITLEPCCKFDMPNAFTPNGDGRNDYFGPVSMKELNITDFSIYNRWGQLVYKGFGPEVGWDGKLKGKDMAQGIYNYIIEFKCDGKPYSKKGDINLIR